MEDRGKQPMAVHMFAKTARKQSRLCASVYGEERMWKRSTSIDGRSGPAGNAQSAPEVTLLTEMWGRSVYRYNMCISACGQFCLGRYDEFGHCERTKRLPRAPDERGGTSRSPLLLPTLRAIKDVG